MSEIDKLVHDENCTWYGGEIEKEAQQTNRAAEFAAGNPFNNKSVIFSKGRRSPISLVQPGLSFCFALGLK